MNVKELNKLVEDLNTISIKSYPNIRWGNVVYYSLYYYEKKKYIYEVKAVLAPILKGRYTLECIGKSGLVFLFSSAYADRSDHKENFDKVLSQVQDKSVLVYEKGGYFKNIFRLHKIITIFHKLGRIRISSQLKRFICYWIYSYICEQEEIESVLRKNDVKMKALISYCDVMPVDSMLVQYYKNFNVKTLTMQHGQFNVETEKGKAAYEKSYSDYFLCFGNYTKTTCKKLKINQDKLIPLGPPEIIGKKLPAHMKKMYQQKFGVVMSSFEERDENIRLLDCADMIANETGYMGMIRPHPSLDISEYTDFINVDKIHVCDKKESIEDFMLNVDFAIVGTSSVFQSFVLMLVPIYRYIVEGKEDPFREISWCAFSDIASGINKIKEGISYPERVEVMLIDTRNKLIGEGEVALRYREFFSNLLKEI